MKRTLLIVLTCALALTAVAVGALAVSSSRGQMAIAEGEPAKTDTLTVQGTADISIEPDIAYVTLGAYTENKDAKAAQTENAKIMAEIVKAIKAAGVNEKDIQTAQYYVGPIYDYSQNKQELTGYSVNNSLKVTVRDINKIGDVIDAAAGAGANTSGGVSFGLTDNSKVYNQALEAAIADASAKAATMAKAASRVIDSSYQIVESGTQTEAVYNDLAKSSIAGAGMRDGGAVVQAGELTVSAAVVIVYKLK